MTLNINKKQYLNELSNKLTHMYQRRKSKIGDTHNETEWIKGYMHAGVTLGIITSPELNEVIYDVQISTFGRKLDSEKNNKNEHRELIIDESIYEIPAVERKKKSN